jgi:hypothetical protein
LAFPWKARAKVILNELAGSPFVSLLKANLAGARAGGGGLEDERWRLKRRARRERAVFLLDVLLALGDGAIEESKWADGVTLESEK